MIRLLMAATAGLLAAALGGCASRALVPAASCRLERMALLPLAIVHRQPVIPARLDAHPVALLVDTGSEGSMLTPEAVKRLGLPRNIHRYTVIQGAGGSLVSFNADVRRLAIGTLAMDRLSLSVGPMPSLTGTGVAGLIGADWLGDFDVDLDMPHRRFALWRVSGCGPGFDPIKGRHFSLPLTRTSRGRVLLPVTVDGTHLLAYLDSGAVGTAITKAAAERIGVSDAALSRDRRGFARGVDLRQVGSRMHKFAELRIGPERFRNIAIPVSDLQVYIAGMLLGDDYLAHHRVWISQATRRVFIEPVP